MEVVQVIPKDDYKVIVYFADGAIKRCDVSPLVGKGVFACLSDKDFYEKNCTVLNGTLAWTLDGTYNKYNCIDVDPCVLYEEGERIPDPLTA
ncbi:MAG: DUF2442 domain-containing protein [Treponema sp.]|nr:DUF2442 domain-containing protein [Treponema sp.]MBQ3687038.1 DUF2442 domain-containing protein [Treponema sp.]